ncbi:hypothetical protein [Streptomyces sp. Rer75]|uniref:hypothetical protein n=1 Tax=Streptomyces sp. Rer75 TaxID=2750011 RepID=UPI0015D02425|nr:hypothetical protein [Streptomyces sp. Rer75]QLH23929.1 hypothetical protein HYQ63_27630 [Streptomyces sp. Rer75]
MPEPANPSASKVIGERDGEIASWGLAHPDGQTDVTSVEGTRRLSLNSPERAAWWFSREKDVSAWLIWFDSVVGER